MGMLRSGVAFSAAPGAFSGKLIAWKGSCSYLAQSYFGIWQMVWIVMVVFVSLNYCVTKYNGDTDTERWWFHYNFSSSKISTQDKPFPCSLYPRKTRDTLNTS